MAKETERRIPQSLKVIVDPVDPVAQWRAVEDAVRGMTDPSLASVREQLVDVLRTNYEVLDE